MSVSLWLILFTLFTYDASSGLFTLSALLPELVSLILKNHKIDFDMSELKWIVVSLRFFRFFLLHVLSFLFGWHFFGTTDYGSVDYFIYWRHANSNTCRTAALHAILSFFVYDPQGQGVCVWHTPGIIIIFILFPWFSQLCCCCIDSEPSPWCMVNLKAQFLWT